MPANTLVVARYAHRHMAADVDGNGGDVATRVREQTAELLHGRAELVVLKERNAILGHQHATRLHAAATTGVKLSAEQNLSRADRIRRVDDDNVETAVGCGNIFGAVVDHGDKTWIGEDRFGEFGKMLLGKLNNRRVDLHLGEALHRPV